MYRIRIKSSIHNDANTYISTTIPICALQKSGFREEIILHRDLHGNFIGMSYSSPVIALPRPCDPHAVISIQNILYYSDIVYKLNDSLFLMF